MFIILFVFSVVLLVLLYKHSNGTYWKKRNIVQLDAHSWHFMIGKCSLSEVYKNIYDKYPSQDYVGTFVGIKPVLVLRNLQDIQAILQSDFKSFPGRGYKTNPKDVLADNLLLIDDYNRWRILRQKLTPVFTGAKIKKNYVMIERCASNFVEFIETNQHAKENPYRTLHTYTSASISAAIFGIDSPTQNIMDDPILDIAWRSTESHLIFNIKFATSFFFPKLFNFLNLKVFGERQDFILGVLNKISSFRRNIQEKRHDFIDFCLESRRYDVTHEFTDNYNFKITDEVLAAQALSFFIAGVETGANLMNFVLLELSNNPEILRKLQDEIDKIFDGCNEKLTFDELTKMEYMDMIINEGMRKYPPIGLVQRICTKDTILPGGNRTIKKNTLVTIPIYAIHRDEKYFPKPDVFDPERFSPENIIKIPKFCYFPFGEGHRMCLGARFARVQIKAGLAWLLRRYTLKGYNYISKCFDPSFFAVKDSKARYDLVPRNLNR